MGRAHKSTWLVFIGASLPNSHHLQYPSSTTEGSSNVNIVAVAFRCRWRVPLFSRTSGSRIFCSQHWYKQPCCATNAACSLESIHKDAQHRHESLGANTKHGRNTWTEMDAAQVHNSHRWRSFTALTACSPPAELEKSALRIPAEVSKSMYSLWLSHCERLSLGNHSNNAAILLSETN